MELVIFLGVVDYLPNIFNLHVYPFRQKVVT